MRAATRDVRLRTVPFQIHGDDVQFVNNQGGLVMTISSPLCREQTWVSHQLICFVPLVATVDKVTLPDIYSFIAWSCAEMAIPLRWRFAFGFCALRCCCGRRCDVQHARFVARPTKQHALAATIETRSFQVCLDTR